MTTREEAIEKIAQEEVYPARIKRDFVEWPSRSIRHVHMEIATKIYEDREEAKNKKSSKAKSAPVETEEDESGPERSLADTNIDTEDE